MQTAFNCVNGNRVVGGYRSTKMMQTSKKKSVYSLSGVKIMTASPGFILSIAILSKDIFMIK